MHLEVDTIDIVGLVAVSIGVAVFTPIVAYALHQFYILRDYPIIKKRNVSLVIIMNIFIIMAIFDRAVVCMSVIWDFDSMAPGYAQHILLGLCISSIYLLIAVRTWFWYFEQKYHLSVAHAAWKKLINERAHSWFIRHRKTFGDVKYLIKVGAIPCVIYMTLCIGMEVLVEVAWSASIMTTFVAMAINWLLHALPLLFSCIIYYRFHSKQFRDLYHISMEIKYQCIIIVIYEVLQCSDLVFQLITKEAGVWENLARIETLFKFVVTVCFLFALSIYTSTYPVYLHLKTDQSNRLSEFVAMDSNSRRRGGLADLGTLIGHKEGFRALMMHLILERSTENLLFIVELVQIKYAFQLRNRNVVIVPRYSVVDSVGTKSLLANLNQQHLKVPSLQFDPESGTAGKGNSESRLSASGGNGCSEITKYSNTVSLQQHSERYLDNDKYAVLDFNADNVTSTPRPIATGQATPLPALPPAATPTTSNIRNNNSTGVPASPSEFVMIEYPDTKAPASSPKNLTISAAHSIQNRSLSPVAEIQSPTVDDREDEAEDALETVAEVVPEASPGMTSPSDIDEEDDMKSVEEEVEEEEESVDGVPTMADLLANSNPPNRPSRSVSRSRSTPPSEAQDEPPTGPGNAPPFPAQPTISSLIMSSVMRLRSMSDVKSKAKVLPKPLKIKKKLPGMYTYLFRKNGTVLMKLALPPGLPPSSALEDIHKSNNLALQMEYIYEKFIKPESTYEVNLSYGVRQPLIKFFERDGLHKNHGKVESFIFNIFDQAALMILQLMVDSFGRFAKTKTCKIIQKEIEKEREVEDSCVSRTPIMSRLGVGGGFDVEASRTATGDRTNGLVMPHPLVRNATSMRAVMHQYELTSCGGVIRVEDLEKRTGITAGKATEEP